MTHKSGVRSTVLLFLSGALSACLIILNLALVPLLLLCGLLALALPFMQAASLRTRIVRSLIAGAWFGFGMTAILAVYGLLAGHSPLQVTSIALNVHFGMARAYLAGVGLHLWDFVLFTGVPLVMLAFLIMTVRPHHNAQPDAPRVLGSSLGLTLLVLVLSGTAQGEVGRVWLFFMPFVALLATCVLARLSWFAQGALIVAQGVWLLALVATTAPVDTWLGPRPSYAEVAFAPLDRPVAHADARFGDELRLTGFGAEVLRGTETLAVVLEWKALREMSKPYYFSAVLVGPDGRVLPGVDWQPFGKRFPTTCWTPGLGTIADRIELPLGADPPAGDWWLSLTIFAVDSDGQPALLPVILPDGTSDRQAGIGPLRVDRP